MSNLRFSLVNLLDKDAYAPTLKNGTGGGAPSRDETTGYVMEQATYRDRYVIWRTSAAPAATLDVDFDLGSDKALSCAAVLGLELDGAPPATCVVKTATAAAGYGVWTTRGTITLGSTTERDAGVAWASANARYVRFEFTSVTVRFGVGRLWAGAVTDTGYVYGGQGSSETVIQYGVSDVLPGGVPIDSGIGYEGRAWNLSFTGMTSTVRDYFWSVLRRREPVVLMDSADAFYEVRVPSRSITVGREFVNVYSPNVELMRLP